MRRYVDLDGFYKLIPFEKTWQTVYYSISRSKELYQKYYLGFISYVHTTHTTMLTMSLASVISCLDKWQITELVNYMFTGLHRSIHR